MRPDVFELIGYGSLALLMAYVGLHIWRRRSAPKQQASITGIGNVHIEALRENSELLRELIAVNRKLLEKQEQRNI